MITFITRPEKLNAQAEALSPEILFQIIGDIRGKIIGDIGSGGGYFAMEFARRIGPLGFVHAIDVNARNLKHIDKLISRYEISNMDTLLSPVDSIPLARDSVDMFFNRNAFHHIREPEGYFRKLLPVLKPGGRIVIIDYKPGRFSLRQLLRHWSAPETIVEMMKNAGYDHVSTHNVYNDQSFNIFRKPA